MRNRTKGAIVVAAVAAASGIVSAPAAHADPEPWHCPAGNVCAWDAEIGAHNIEPIIKTEGNWRGSVWIKGLMNHGVRYPGKDHIQAVWEYDGKTWERCLHYYPGPGQYWASFPTTGVVLKSLTWRGECEF